MRSTRGAFTRDAFAKHVGGRTDGGSSPSHLDTGAAAGRDEARGSAVCGPMAANQFDGVLYDSLEHRQSVAYAARTAREIDDESAAADARGAAGESGTWETGVDGDAKRFGDAGGFFVEDDAGGLRGYVARGEAGAAGGEDEIGAVPIGPLGEGRGNGAGLVGNEPPVGQAVAAGGGPGGDRVARGIGPLATVACVADRQDGDAHGGNGGNGDSGGSDEPTAVPPATALFSRSPWSRTAT